VKSITAGDKVALRLVISAAVLKAKHGPRGLKRADCDVVNLKVQGARCRGACFNEILDDFVLPVDGNRFACRQVGQIDAVPLSLKADVESLMTQPCTLETCADAHRRQQVHGTLLKDARSHAVDDVLAAMVFDNDGVDTIQMKQMPKQQSGRACSNNSHLCP